MSAAVLLGWLALLGARPAALPAPQGPPVAAGVVAGPPLGAPRGGDMLPYMGLLSAGVGVFALALAVQARVCR